MKGSYLCNLPNESLPPYSALSRTRPQCAPFVFTAGFGNDGIADVTSLTTNPLSKNGGSSKIGIS